MQMVLFIGKLLLLLLILFKRDIKPENIMFQDKVYGTEGILKLVDFGTASILLFILIL